jgi:hypothetical protein
MADRSFFGVVFGSMSVTNASIEPDCQRLNPKPVSLPYAVRRNP